MNRFRIVPGSCVQVAYIGRDNLAEQKTVAYISGCIKYILGTHNVILFVFGGKIGVAAGIVLQLALFMIMSSHRDDARRTT